MLDFLKFLGYVAVMLAVVPLVGLMVSGSRKAAWQYTKDWFRSIGLIALVALVIGLMIHPFTL